MASQLPTRPLVALGLLAALACSAACGPGQPGPGQTGSTSSGSTSSGSTSSGSTKPEQHISSMLGGFYGPAPWVQPANVNSINCAYPQAIQVAPTGVVVTAVDTFDETGKGATGTLYVQDDVSPVPTYAGMALVALPGSKPPPGVSAGDVVDVPASYGELSGPASGVFSQCETLPELVGAAAVHSAGAVPAPVVITPADLSTYDGARRYLGMLVTVKAVTIAASGVDKDGRYTADVAVSSGTNWAISNELFDVANLEPLTQGQAFSSVTGIVTYLYSFHLAPRSVADFVSQ